LEVWETRKKVIILDKPSSSINSSGREKSAGGLTGGRGGILKRMIKTKRRRKGEAWGR